MRDFASDILGDTPVTWDNFLDTPPQDSDGQSAGVVIIPVPYDGTTSYKAGARHGPRAIINASKHLEDYDLELDRDISQVGIYTLPEILPIAGDPKATIELVRGLVSSVASAGKLPMVLGGEHTVAVGAVQALSSRYPDLSVLYLDAHADLRDTYMGTQWGHASVARRVSELCSVVQVGVRSLSVEERDYIRDMGISVFFWDPPTMDSTDLSAAVLGALTEHVYISVDLDVLDPSVMPAVGTPEPGGMSWRQVTELLRTICDHRQIVGFDLSELSPAEGPESSAFTAAKLAYKAIGYATTHSFTSD